MMSRFLVLPLWLMGQLVARMPGRLRMKIGALLGWGLRGAGFRRSVVRSNIQRMLPDQTERLEVEAYRHLGRLILELTLLFGGLRRFVARRSKLIGAEHWREARAHGRGVIFLSSHVGNWEVMAATGAVNGLDIMLVTKRLKPAWIHQAVERGRASCSVDATYEPRTFKDILRRLQKGMTVGLILDQYAGAPIGIRVPFFGTPVGTHSVVATLAKRTRAVVLPVANRRNFDGTFEVRIGAPIEWIPDADPGRELGLNTARYAQIMEAHVRECPEQWLWTHRRFKGDLGPLRADEWAEGRARK